MPRDKYAFEKLESLNENVDKENEEDSSKDLHSLPPNICTDKHEYVRARMGVESLLDILELNFLGKSNYFNRDGSSTVTESYSTQLLRSIKLLWTPRNIDAKLKGLEISNTAIQIRNVSPWPVILQFRGCSFPMDKKHNLIIRMYPSVRILLVSGLAITFLVRIKPLEFQGTKDGCLKFSVSKLRSSKTMSIAIGLRCTQTFEELIKSEREDD